MKWIATTAGVGSLVLVISSIIGLVNGSDSAILEGVAGLLVGGTTAGSLLPWRRIIDTLANPEAAADRAENAAKDKRRAAEKYQQKKTEDPPISKIRMPEEMASEINSVYKLAMKAAGRGDQETVDTLYELWSELYERHVKKQVKTAPKPMPRQPEQVATK